MTAESALDAITSRRSVRGFRPDAVAPDLVKRILTLAGTAPSGSNIQPWRVHVVTGEARDRLSHDLLAAFTAGEPEQREYQYYPEQWRSPYIERRRATGWGLYARLGIAKGDRHASAQQHGENFRFFGAPLVMLFAIDRDLGVGSWLDYGMFLQTIMIAARAFGLHTCAQAALANYPDIIKRHLDIPEAQTIVCGISMGYADAAHPANQFQPARMPLEDFVAFHG